MNFAELPKELLNRARELDDSVIADVSLVRTAKAAVDQATEEWNRRVNVSLAAKEALDSLIARGTEAAQEVEQIAEQRRVVALRTLIRPVLVATWSLPSVAHRMSTTQRRISHGNLPLTGQTRRMAFGSSNGDSTPPRLGSAVCGHQNGRCPRSQ